MYLKKDTVLLASCQRRPCPPPSTAGVPVSSRVSAKIQQLVNTLKRPKRPPLREFFVDDFEELLEGTSDAYLAPHTFSGGGWMG